MLSMNLYSLLITLPILVLSLSVHEYAHACTAYRLGDSTPKWQGRLTLNPLAHMDPIGLLVLVVTGRFGWAKPVMVNPNNFENRDAGMVMVSLAGPGSNLVLAITLATIFKAIAGGPYGTPANAFLYYLLVALNQGVWINLGLAVFNLLPVPPLDGSKILAALLKGRGARMYYTLERYSYIVLLLLIATPLAGWILTPIISVLYRTIM
jgi:Zn-dependent protease